MMLPRISFTNQRPKDEVDLFDISYQDVNNFNSAMGHSGKSRSQLCMLSLSHIHLISSVRVPKSKPVVDSCDFASTSTSQSPGDSNSGRLVVQLMDHTRYSLLPIQAILPLARWGRGNVILIFAQGINLVE